MGKNRTLKDVMDDAERRGRNLTPRQRQILQGIGKMEAFPIWMAAFLALNRIPPIPGSAEAKAAEEGRLYGDIVDEDVLIVRAKLIEDLN